MTSGARAITRTWSASPPSPTPTSGRVRSGPWPRSSAAGSPVAAISAQPCENGTRGESAAGGGDQGGGEGDDRGDRPEADHGGGQAARGGRDRGEREAERRRRQVGEAVTALDE